MIREYHISKWDEAHATPYPRHIWIDGDRIVVSTGKDIPSQPVANRVIPAWQFRDRFQDSELDAILAAAYAEDAVARRLLLKIQTATDGINLDSPEVVGGLGYCTSKGWIAAERAAVLRS